MDRLVLGGGYDILHAGHRKFMDIAIAQALSFFPEIKHITLYVKSDEFIARTKGESRPYFSWQWRVDDVLDYISSYTSAREMSISAMSYDNTSDMVHNMSDTDVVILRNSCSSFDKVPARVLKFSEVGGTHSSDFIKSLKMVQGWSDCLLTQVGALLIRDGTIMVLGANGGVGAADNPCASCPKYAEHIGKGYEINDSNIYTSRCNAKHAEELVMLHAKPGDDLLITHSPCSSCAQEIIDRGIRRVVYLEEYRSTKGLSLLDGAGIAHRQAGVTK